MKSKNTVIDKETREELGNLSVIFWQDQYFVENNEAETSFWEENKYGDYYEGFTHLQFPLYTVAQCDHDFGYLDQYVQNLWKVLLNVYCWNRLLVVK